MCTVFFLLECLQLIAAMAHDYKVLEASELPPLMCNQPLCTEHSLCAQGPAACHYKLRLARIRKRTPASWPRLLESKSLLAPDGFRASRRPRTFVGSLGA